MYLYCEHCTAVRLKYSTNVIKLYCGSVDIMFTFQKIYTYINIYIGSV